MSLTRRVRVDLVVAEVSSIEMDFNGIFGGAPRMTPLVSRYSLSNTGWSERAFLDALIDNGSSFCRTSFGQLLRG
jgi:hypothetical protein